MANDILIGDIRFWVEKNIIYCKIYSEFDEDSIGRDIEDIFFNSITTLSNGKYMPILINVREVNFLLAIKIFNYLSINSLINSSLLSKTFLVNSVGLKVILSLYNVTRSCAVPNTIFKDHHSAIDSCNSKYMLFNPIALK